MNHPKLPNEILGLIFDFALDSIQPTSSRRDPSKYSSDKRILLNCALTCRSWLPLARRLLISLCFPEGRVKVKPYEREVYDLAELFRSPLRTLDPAFIKILVAEPAKSPSGSPYLLSESFSRALTVFDEAPLPALHTLVYNGISPIPCDNRRPYEEEYIPDTPSPAIFSQITSIKFHSPMYTRFEMIVYTIRLCPVLEAVTAYGGRYDVMEHELYPPLLPPKSLRRLELDMDTYPEMIEWFMTCDPNHTTVSSLSLHWFSWEFDLDSADLRWFLDGVGENLEELELWSYGTSPGGEFSCFHYPRDLMHLFLCAIASPRITEIQDPLNQFTENTALRRFLIGGPPGIVCGVLPYLFQHAHFAPQLDVLEVFITDCSLDAHLNLFSNLEKLDVHLRSRSSIRHIVISWDHTRGSFSDKWGEMENRIRKYLPYCEEKGMIEFKAAEITK